MLLTKQQVENITNILQKGSGGMRATQMKGICISTEYRNNELINTRWNNNPPKYHNWPSASTQDALSKTLTSERGGWCKEITTTNGGKHNTDKTLIPRLSGFLLNKHVASFGDGQGVYKREMLKLGQLKSYTAYDGAPFCEETSGGIVQFLDLTIPQYGIPIFDWILSLEVAEHIPKQYEAIYLDNIFRHAKEGIIISWAVPGQGGIQHVNNKPLSYVINVMANNGFYRNETLSKYLQLSASFSWLRSNINIYFRTNKSEFGSKIGEIYLSA